MKKQSIREVIAEVLKRHGQPMSATEIFEVIQAKGLYDFKAKDPANIVRGQLRRHCLDAKSASGRIKCFEMTDEGLFRLLDSPVSSNS